MKVLKACALALLLTVVAVSSAIAQNSQCPTTLQMYRSMLNADQHGVSPYQLSMVQSLCAEEIQQRYGMVFEQSISPAPLDAYFMSGANGRNLVEDMEYPVCDGGIYAGEQVHRDRCLTGKTLDGLFRQLFFK